jgi:Predicted flavoprotein
MSAESQELRVVALVGSLRRASYTRRLVQALGILAPPELNIETVPLGNLPLYNEDAETATPPAQWRNFRDRVKRADAILFATPEYNRSVPGALKNAIDVGSRPYGASVWTGKPAAVLSVSPGALGAFGANHHLRQSLVFLDMPVLQQPEAYIGGIAQLIDPSGEVTRPDTQAFLRQFLEQFERWIRQQRLKVAP